MMLLTHFVESYYKLKKWVFGLAMRTYKKYDAKNPHEHKEDSMGENVQVGNADIESNARIYQDTPPNFASTMRILRVEMQSYREYNEILVKAQEE